MFLAPSATIFNLIPLTARCPTLTISKRALTNEAVFDL